MATKNWCAASRPISMYADISDKLKALLVIAGKVQRGGKHVTSQMSRQARSLRRYRH